MFIHAVPDNRSKKDGYYCSLVKSRRTNGIPSHTTVISFGFLPSERVPYLKAAFNDGRPEEILAKAKRSQEEKGIKR